MLAAVLLAVSLGATPPRITYTWDTYLQGAHVARRDTLALHYDALASDRWRPEVLRDIRRRPGGSDMRFVLTWTPQTVMDYDGKVDTVNSILDLWELLCYQNNWYLRDASGAKVGHPTERWVNMTLQCPRGTFGRGRGKTAVEALPGVLTKLLEKRFGEPWRTEAWTADNVQGSAMNGWQPETWCWRCEAIARNVVVNADADGDGRADGLDLLATRTNAGLNRFWQLWSPWILAHPDIPIGWNSGDDAHDPLWRWLIVDWIKFENGFFLGKSIADWRYGWGGGVHMEGQPGWLTATWDPRYPSTSARLARFTLGYAMMSDIHWWQPQRYDGAVTLPPEIDLDFGEPTGPAFHHAMGGDTILVRNFQFGQVKVNVGQRKLFGLEPMDARFTRW